jgi:hypothetical protein
MVSKKAKKKTGTTKADLEIKARKENLLIEKEKRYQVELKKMRRPQVEKLTTLKEKKKTPLSKVKLKKKASR